MCPHLEHFLTSTQSSLGVEDVPSKSDGLGHHLLIKCHFFGVVQSVTHQCRAKDVLHGFTQVRFIAHQGQSCVDVFLSNLTKEEGKRERGEEKRRCENVKMIRKEKYIKETVTFQDLTEGLLIFFFQNRKDLVLSPGSLQY